MYILDHAPLSLALAPHTILEELGVEYRLNPVELYIGGKRRPSEGAPVDGKQRADAHPVARVPVLRQGEHAFFESSAMIMHLCDRHTDARLAPEIGTTLRGEYYQWMVFFPSHVHRSMSPFYHPYRFSKNEEHFEEIQIRGREATNNIFEVLDQRLVNRQWVLGSQFSACDHVLHCYASFVDPSPRARKAYADVGYPALDHLRTWDTFPNLRRFMLEIRKRPSIANVLEENGIGDFSESR